MQESNNDNNSFQQILKTLAMGGIMGGTQLFDEEREFGRVAK